MNIGVFLAASLLFVIAVSNVSGRCCGFGHHGFCYDCSKVNVLYKRKCCGLGSGHGLGCNIFCCNCGACRAGHPKIKKRSGWWWWAKYTCEQHDSEQAVHVDVLQDTWEVFNKIDRDRDNEISPHEFLYVFENRLMKRDESAHLLASDVLETDDVDAITSFVDSYDGSNDAASYFFEEFRKMDSNGDGMIQSTEFDKDLA